MLPTLSAHTTTPAHDIGYYPASLCVLILWLVVVVLLLWLLESAVKHRPENVSQPWAYATLPGLLATVFAQGHAAVTAMYLSHVSVSALHSVRMSPSTWAFHLLRRVTPSLTCLTALVTSIILSRAYPIRTITVNEDTTIAPLALSVTRMGAVDAYAEIGTGMGRGLLALSVANTYNSSVYLPSGASRNDDPLDFFAGNVQGTTTKIPVFCLSGQCTPVQTAVSGLSDFPTYCTAQVPDVNTQY
ncbi:hypothetical protein B0H14DRAFT_2610563 [Mycena olivaceomarginata]|nr:hypothetical protein B0H14DRAFT_2610563 [Mycena olivaceomarginata]